MRLTDHKLQLSYKRILKEFLEEQSEESLYEAQKNKQISSGATNFSRRVCEHSFQIINRIAAYY